MKELLMSFAIYPTNVVITMFASGYIFVITDYNYSLIVPLVAINFLVFFSTLTYRETLKMMKKIFNAKNISDSELVKLLEEEAKK